MKAAVVTYAVNYTYTFPNLISTLAAATVAWYPRSLRHFRPRRWPSTSLAFKRCRVRSKAINQSVI
jgi:hypothetical protein